MQFPPFIHFQGFQPFSKPEIPSSVPRGRWPHSPGRTSMCRSGPPFETLLAAGSEPQCSAPSPGSLPLAKTHLTPCLTAYSGALAGVPEALPRLLHWLPVHLELRTCSVAPSTAPEGNDFLFPVLGARAELASLAGSPRGARCGGGPYSALGPGLSRRSREQASSSFQSTQPPVSRSCQPPRIPRSSYRSLHVPGSDCIP